MGNKQGTVEWFEERLGKVTASRFGDILTQPRRKDRVGDLSRTAESYMMEKITEVLTGESRELQSAALDWGSAYESEAREFYEFQQLTEVEEVGFILHPRHEKVGGSPDGLVGDEGMIEIKCHYNSVNHVEYFYGAIIAKRYIAQMQGNMWISGRKWCDFISYDPRVKDGRYRMYVERVERDEALISAIEITVMKFIEIYNSKLSAL